MMEQGATLCCACGEVAMRATGQHIASVECCCTSCRTAGQILSTLPGSKLTVNDMGATRYVMQRKDRLTLLKGGEHLREFRLKPESKTRRVVATCCNTPVFAEFQGGHWLSIYSGVWSVAQLPPLELRTMCRDLPQVTVLPNDVPNAKTHSLKFYAQLLGAWISMGLRVPKIDYVKGVLNVTR